MNTTPNKDLSLVVRAAWRATIILFDRLKIIVVRQNAIPSGATCWAIFEPFNNRTLSSV
jgi:hypothetical protein